MGSMNKEEMGIGDCGVGSIVWVRRRNGSWWPGKILGPAEMSAANLVSPRSGTPVKLLGREDASVDWYNLEKSKRVKPFRCGEFDECIEKAESALGMPPKKREKYARREDAILHALELEKQLVDNNNGNLGSPVEGHRKKSSGIVKIEPAISSKYSKYGNIKRGSKKVIIATKNEDVDDPLCPQEVNGVSQMRGEVLLPHISSFSSKRKLSSSTSLYASRKSERDNFDSDLPISGLVSDKTSIPNIRVSLEKKRKLPNVVKRRDRRCTLVQVLKKSEKEQIRPTSHTKTSALYLPCESNDCSDEEKLVSPIAMAESPSHLERNDFSRPSALDEESGSESTESTETDSSKTRSIDSGKDAEMVGLAEPAFIPELEEKCIEIPGQMLHKSMSIESPGDNDVSLLYHHDCVSASLGVNRWQIKGKRNKRSLTRRSTVATDRWVAIGSMYTSNIEEVESDGFDETGNQGRSFATKRSSHYSQRLAYNRNITNWEDFALNEQPMMRGSLDYSRNYLDSTVGIHRFEGGTKPGLLDVDLKVQSSYQREHVPLISLRSKLNGKAIVGHPIQVEILGSGSTNSLISPSNEISLESTEHFQNANQNKKSHFNKSEMGKSGQKKGILNGVFSRKPPKQTSLSSNHKIKNLSAIDREQRFGNNFRSGDKKSFRMGAMIKGEVGPTTVACIPVKLVYCRLNEELVGRATNKMQ